MTAPDPLFVHHRPRKRFGQNFLHDPWVLQQLAAMLPSRAPHETWLEIGPGQGALTAELLKRSDCPKPLSVIEIDRDLVALLKQKYSDQLQIDNRDVLEVDLKKINASKIRVIGNLPYNISTPILFHLLDFLPILSGIHVMLQKEVVDRIVATPKHPDYGRLSVMIQYAMQSEQEPLIIPPHCFTPAPKVHSAWLNLVPKSDDRPRAIDERIFSAVVQAAFGMRRKTLRNALKQKWAHLDWTQLPVDPARRAETLAVQEFVALANAIAVIQI